ncbi:MAG TPA: hypothetical protein VIW67_12320 [Terriglobales bacterium]|jgi:hypothetical protein
MTIQTLDKTPNFTIKYDDQYANALALAQAIIGRVEDEFTVLATWFAINSGFGSDHRVQVSLEKFSASKAKTAAAYNYGYDYNLGIVTKDPEIHIDISGAAMWGSLENKTRYILMMLVAELSEIFMSYNVATGGPGVWARVSSAGEGLSHYCQIARYPGIHAAYYGHPINAWLTSSDRPDWITENEDTDGNEVSWGCSLLFIYYLVDQLGHSGPWVIQNGGGTLENTYKALTNQQGGNPGSNLGYTAFTDLLNQYFPIGHTPGLDTNDPFPLLDVTRRSVNVRLGEQVFGIPHVSDSGDLERQFLLCPKKKYHWDLLQKTVLLEIDADASGFGLPQYSWSINGTALPSGYSTMTTLASVYTPDPSAPEDYLGSMALQPVDVICTVYSTVSKSDLILRLGPAFENMPGEIDLLVTVSVVDKYFHPTESDSRTLGEALTNTELKWDSAYLVDKRSCSEKWFNATKRRLTSPFDNLNHSISVILTLPDPPAELRFGLRHLEHIALMWDSIEHTQSQEVKSAFSRFLSRHLAVSSRLKQLIASLPAPDARGPE